MDHHRYDEASEIQFFKRHKMKMEIPTKISHAVIEQPTGDDLEWAKDIYHTKRGALSDDLPKPQSLWRIGFLMNIPDHGSFKYYGLDDELKRTLLSHYVKEENIEAVKLCSHYSERHVYYTPFKDAVKDASPSFVKEFADHLASLSKNICNNPDIFAVGVERGDLTIVQTLYDHGADIVTDHQAKVEFALSKQRPEVAKFLTDTYDKIQEKAGLKDKAKPALKTSNGDKWERMGENQIAKHSTFDEGKQSLTEIFNFDSQQIITVQNNARLNTSSSFAQNFKDIQNQDYIKAAATELVNLGGSRTEAPVKLSLPRKGVDQNRH